MYNLRFLFVAIALSLACAQPAKAEENSDGDAFIEYVRIHSMVAGNDGRYVMRWMTDGRVEVEVPPYARNGGRHVLEPGEYDIDTLENVISRTERAQQELQNIDIRRSMARSGEIHQVHDADIVLIKTHPHSRSPVDLRIESPDHWSEVMSNDQALAVAADIDRILMDWIQTHASAR
jgi:hypothetical protein